MQHLLTRTFEADTNASAAWNHLIAAEAWPSWAHHLSSVVLTPPGPASADTAAVLRLTNRTRATVAMTEFDDQHRFRWDGRFLWLDLGYDHRVEPIDDSRSRITFTVFGHGIGINSIGRVFARIYGRNLDAAIPRLQAELAALH